MAKTYNTFTNVSTGDVLTATNFNNVLTNVEGYRSPALVKLRRATTQSINNATDTFVTWPVEDIDNDGCYTATSDTVTIQTSGVYLVSASVYFAANNTGQRVLNIYKNPSSVSDFASVVAASWAQAVQTLGTMLSASAIVDVTALQTLKVGVYQSSGGALNVGDTGFTSATQFSIAWIGRGS